MKKYYNAFDALLQNGDFFYKKEDSEQLIYNKLSNFNKKVPGIGAPKLWDSPEKGEYLINTHGFRGKDFSHSPSDILTAGCSQTWGIGCPNGYIWPDIIESKTGLSVNNVALPAISVARIVQIIFAYFKEVGNPKYLFINFPDFTRITLPTTNGVLHSLSDVDNHKIIVNTSLGPNRNILNKPAYSKMPFMIEEVLTEEVTIWQALSYIQVLEQYCASSGIKLKYGSWDKETSSFLNNISKEGFYKGYVNLEPESWYPENHECLPQYYKDVECHENLKNSDNEYYWYLANDRDTVNTLPGGKVTEKNIPHIGVHRHFHIADIFTKEIA